MLQLNSEYDFEHAPCGYITLNPSGQIIQVNQTLLRWIGYKKDEIIGIKDLSGITAPGTTLYFQMFVFPLLKMQGYVNEISVEFISGTGNKISCLFNASAVKCNEGQIQTIHAIVFGITERKKYEAEILAAKKKLEAVAEHKERILQVQRRIMAILGHDTRAPLTAVNKMIKLAADGTISTADLSPYLDLMANQIDATLILIGDLLRWSDAVLNDGKEKTASFSLCAVVEEVFELLQSNAQTKGILLHNKVPHQLGLTASRSVIAFIIRNLVNNSIKFTAKGGVTVSAVKNDDCVEITVADTGIGMCADQLDKFRTGSLSSTPGTANETGSGMGMVLVKEFLLNAKATLHVDSVLHHGTIITVRVTQTEQDCKENSWSITHDRQLQGVY